MGSRKRSHRKPSPAPPAPSGASSSISPPPDTATDNAAKIPQPPMTDESSSSTPANDTGSTTPKSWYGTWPKKSLPSTKTTREGVLSRPNILPVDDTRVGDQRLAPATNKSLSRPPSMLQLGKSKETADITLTAPDLEDKLPASNIDQKDKDEGRKDGVVDESAAPSGGVETSLPTLERKPPTELPAELPTRPRTASSWFGWLGSQNTTAEPLSPPQTKEEPKPAPEISADSAPTNRTEATTTPAVAQEEDGKDRVQAVQQPSRADAAATPRSWLTIWSSTQSSAPKIASATGPDTTMTETGPPEQAEPATQAPENTGAESDAQQPPVPSPAQPKLSQPSPGSSWAFWYRDSNKSSQSVTETGQIAIAGDESEHHPQPAQASVQEAPKPPKGKRERADTDSDDGVPKKITQKTSESPKKKVAAGQASTSLKLAPPNLLLPSFRDTFHPFENPSMLQQITRMLLRTKQPVSRQCAISPQPPMIKKAVAIGIHGLFPAAFLRPMIGQPTGTSVRFSNHAAAAIKRWAATHGRGFQDIEVEKVALEGEGKIGERVENLWKLLLNWTELLRQADFIFVACHSQGVPVGIMLVAKLIESGIVSSAKIGICAMAGVSLGPFTDYKSRFLGGSAVELFDFANSKSVVSKNYIDALRVALEYGTRITYCGSIDDQLVSLESSTFSIVSHPYIFRTVFVDGRLYSADFMTRLVGFALKLRNLGVSDHGLIRELSAPLAGSIYTGEGHSRLYDDPQVYDLVVDHTLHTTSVGDEPLRVQNYEAPITQNPYLLPWSIRGLLEEDIVKTDLNREATELLHQFEEWKPTTKVLKDVKFRLEAVRSKL